MPHGLRFCKDSQSTGIRFLLPSCINPNIYLWIAGHLHSYVVLPQMVIMKLNMHIILYYFPSLELDPLSA